MKADLSYKKTLDILYGMMPDFQNVGAGAYKPGLERIETFLNDLGNPHKSLQCIHIAGTNGKGSTSHMLASVLAAAGYKTGLYTSPHLHDFRERIKVNGEMIPEEEVINFAAEYLERMEELRLSFFEATVAMAFYYFKEQGVQAAVIETGLGGRLDATNIIKPVLSIITNIGMDHMSFLGNTIEQIAAEKAGIIKPGIPVIIGERDTKSFPVFADIAKRCNSELIPADTRYRYVASRRKTAGDPEIAQGASSGTNEDCILGDGTVYTIEDIRKGNIFETEVDLLGRYQRKNILTTLTAVDILRNDAFPDITDKAIFTGLATTSVSTGLMGRWQIIGRKPLTVCDTGHNEHGIREVVEQIENENFHNLYIVLGVVNDKDLSSILPLMPKYAHYIFTQASVGRALPADELATEAECYDLEGEIVTGANEALAKARELALPDDMIFIGGSTFTVADLEL